MRSTRRSAISSSAKAPSFFSASFTPRTVSTGTRARLAAAQRYAPKFGIATECGMARARSEDTVRALLKIHADICAGA